MKSVLALAAVAALVSAQDFAGQPQCALPCLAKAIPQSGCDMADTACQCKPETQKKLVPLVAGCLVQSCTKEGELQQAQDAAAAACAAFAAGKGGSASAPASASATATASASASKSYPAETMSATSVPSATAPSNHTSSGVPHSTGSGSSPSGSGSSPSGSGSSPSGTGTSPSGSAVPAGAAGAVIPFLAGGVAAVVALAANL